MTKQLRLNSLIYSLKGKLFYNVWAFLVFRFFLKNNQVNKVVVEPFLRANNFFFFLYWMIDIGRFPRLWEVNEGREQRDTGDKGDRKVNKEDPNQFGLI